MRARCSSRYSRDLRMVIMGTPCPSVSYTHGYGSQKKKPAISPLSSRTPLGGGRSRCYDNRNRLKGILTRMAALGTPLSFRDVLRLRPVRRLWIAQIVSVFGDFLAVFAIIAVVTFKLHGTATQVAMVLVSFMAPLAIVSPLAGVFVDRGHFKRAMIASGLIRRVLVVALVFGEC